MEQGAHWSNHYTNVKRIWGDNPSELAVFAHNFLKESTWFKNSIDIFILDMGCGYGRDAIFLAQNLPCHILGLDNSEKAIEMAREKLPRGMEKRVELLNYDFSHVSDKYDVIFASNLYQFLMPAERAKLRETVKRCLKTGGVLFLSALSVRDPQHFGKGIPVEGEPDSFIDDRYMHFSTRSELEQDFDFLQINALFERDYREKRSNDEHHHISWILSGKRD